MDGKAWGKTTPRVFSRMLCTFKRPSAFVLFLGEPMLAAGGRFRFEAATGAPVK